MDRLDAMATLLAAVDAGSLSAASRRLNTPLTTVSRHISDLEGHLGTRLLNRSSRRLALTDAGHAYAAACRRILDEVGDAERAAAGEYSVPKGELIVTVPLVFGRLHALPVAMEFLKHHPDVDVRLVLADHTVNLLEEHVDLAIRIGALPDSSLRATRVGSIRRVVCGSPAYFAARGTPARPAELSAHDCVTFEGLGAPNAWSFPAGKSELSVPIRSRLTVTTAEAAIDAAVAGIGITRVLSYQVADAVRAGTLAIVLGDAEPAPWPVNLVHVGHRLLPAKLRAFLDFAAPRLKARLSAQPG